MTIDEGYIKYENRWIEGPPPDAGIVNEIERWRQPLFSAGLIGIYADIGVGYGNISLRTSGSSQFVITGTQTGHLEKTMPEHYALVTATDIANNTVWSTGPVKASSEAMTHAAIYALSETIRSVVHVHSHSLWSKLRHVMPTTNADIAYGTPEMADEFTRLWHESRFQAERIAVMAGHEDGIVSFGTSVGDAANRLLRLCVDP